MKKCSRCKKEKPFTDYNSDKTKKDGYCFCCKECKVSISNKYQIKNRISLSQRHNIRNKELSNWLNEIKKTKCCLKCEEKKYYLLDFHHINSDLKLKGVSQIKDSKNKILKEIEKCIVLCSNCHREFHHLEKENNITINEYLNALVYPQAYIL